MDRIEELSARLAEVEAHNVRLMEHVKGQDVLEQQYKSALAEKDDEIKDKRIEELIDALAAMKDKPKRPPCYGTGVRRSEMGDKTFPVSRGGYASSKIQIPWKVAERAYAEYSRRFGTYQSLERLAERGGFSEFEMDVFYPSWREPTP